METTVNLNQPGTRVVHTKTGHVGVVIEKRNAPSVGFSTDWPSAGFWVPVLFDEDRAAGLGSCWMLASDLEVQA
jgi:hypothetical protein